MEGSYMLRCNLKPVEHLPQVLIIILSFPDEHKQMSSFIFYSNLFHNIITMISRRCI
jgi:hypothetical protein